LMHHLFYKLNAQIYSHDHGHGHVHHVHDPVRDHVRDHVDHVPHDVRFQEH